MKRTVIRNRGDRTRVERWLFLLGLIVSAQELSCGEASADLDELRDVVDVKSGDSVHRVAPLYRPPLVVAVWTTWCLTCRTEMPALAAMYQRLHPRGLQVIAVSVDPAPTSVIREFETRYGMVFPTYHDRAGKLMQRWDLLGVPAALYFGANGRLIERHFGPIDWETSAIARTIEKELSPSDTRPTAVR